MPGNLLYLFHINLDIRNMKENYDGLALMVLILKSKYIVNIYIQKYIHILIQMYIFLSKYIK